MTMDENKSRQSPGMTDNQSGQSRNMFSQQEAEEVRIHLRFFSVINLIKFCFNSRLVNYYNNLLPLAIWYQQHQLVECHHGSGPVVHILRMFAQCFLKLLFTSTRHRFIRKTMTFTTRNNLQRLNIRWIPTQQLTFCVMFLKATMCCHGSLWTQILTIGFLVYQFMYKC